MEMARLQEHLPDNVDDISESFERYARILSILVGALERLLKLQDQTAKAGSEEMSDRHEQIRQIEKRLAQLAASGKPAPSHRGTKRGRN